MMRKIKVQLIHLVSEFPDELGKAESLKLGRSRFVRLIPNVLLRTSSSDKFIANEEFQLFKDGSGEFELSSVCLAMMVHNFMEDSNGISEDKMHSNSIRVRCGRRRCKCFSGNVDDDGYDDSSDDEPDCFGGCFGDSNHSSALDACDILKSLVPCASVVERKLLADTARIDFRSEFEIPRPTKIYKIILQTLSVIFVGKPDRLEKIISTVNDAVKQSLKKKDLHFPPWRKAEYVKHKWLAPYTRISPTPDPPASSTPTNSNMVTPTLNFK